MDNIKISLNIELKGATRVREDKYEWINWEIRKKDYRVQGKEGTKMISKGRFKHYNYITKPAILHVNLTEEAYNYMISTDCPSWVHKFKDWKRMTPIQRLENHLNRLCQHHNGVSFTYHIFED